VQSAPAFNHIHVTALTTRLAALLPEPQSPNSTSNHANGSSSSNSSSSSSIGSEQTPLNDELRALVLHVLGLVHSNVEALDARGIANTVWALARMARALHVLCGQPGDAPSQAPHAHTPAVRGTAAAGTAGDTDGATELHTHAGFLASALLHRAGSSQWRLGFSPQV